MINIDHDHYRDHDTVTVMAVKDLFSAEEGFVHNQSGTVPIERLLLIILDLKG